MEQPLSSKNTVIIGLKEAVAGEQKNVKERKRSAESAGTAGRYSYRVSLLLHHAGFCPGRSEWWLDYSLNCIKYSILVLLFSVSGGKTSLSGGKIGKEVLYQIPIFDPNLHILHLVVKKPYRSKETNDW